VGIHYLKKQELNNNMDGLCIKSVESTICHWLHTSGFLDIQPVNIRHQTRTSDDFKTPMSTSYEIQIDRLSCENVTLKLAEDSFRQGWKEAMAGETRPISELWDGIDAG
jgi:hypothetical protein